MTLPSTNAVHHRRSHRHNAPSSSISPERLQILSKARETLVKLIDSGVSLSDPRLQAFLSLIRQFDSTTHQHHHQQRNHSIHPPPPRPPLPPRPPSNCHHAAPAQLLPITARHPHSTSRSFLPHNQATVVAARIALETKYDNVKKDHVEMNVETRTTTNTQLSSDSTTSTATTANDTEYVESIGPTSVPHAPPSVFRAAHQLTRASSAPVSALGANSSKPLTGVVNTSSPSRRPSKSQSRSYNEKPLASQRIGDVNATQAFQIKAQAEAFRRVIRGADIPTELRIAARGAPPSSPAHRHIIKPAAAPVLQRGLSDPDMNNAITTAATDPTLVMPTTEPFDPRRLPRFSLDYVFSESDVIMPGEEGVLSKMEIDDRILVAQIHQRRLRARAAEEKEKIESLPKVRNDVIDGSCNSLSNFPLDGKVRQHRAELLAKLSSINVCVADAVGKTTIPTQNQSKHRKNVKAEALTSATKAAAKTQIQHGRRELPSSSQSKALQNYVLLERAAVPIAVASTPSHTPSLEALQQAREKRVSVRIHNRLQEVSDLLSTSCDEVRRLLLVEQKQLRLLPLQLKVRKRVMSSMHRTLYRPGVSDLGVKRIMKMRRKPVVGNNSAASSTRVANSADNASRTEILYRMQQQQRRMARRTNMLQALTTHGAEFKVFVQQRGNLRKRLMKDLERYFRDRSREEERRKKKEQLDRLRALRNNNEDEYLELLKTTKNQRLIQLLKQTDEYLVQIGAQVERQKQSAREVSDGGKGNDNRNDGGGADDDDNATKSNDDGDLSQSDEDDLSLLKKRRNDYYTITHTISEKVHQPKCLVGGTLKHYQVEGLEWLVSLYNNNLNGILADEMGLGKTIQTLALITYLVEVKNVFGPFLVIVPLSVMSNWTREMDRWAPSLVRVIYKGDPTSRKHIQATQMQGGNYNVLLTTYEFVVKDKNVLGRVKWKYIIMDEGHRMKNADCKLALTLGAKYTSRNRLLLTGTPLQNNMTELWALLNFLLPTIFSSAETFETWFNAPFQASALGDSAELDEEENLLIISRLHQVLRPFMLRRLKTDVESQLPDKVEIVLRCNMSIWQQVLYRQMRNKLGIAGGAGNNGIRSFNNIMMQLKKVCNHPFLFYQEEELMQIPRDYLVRAAGKFELLDHVLRKLQRTGHRVLIFSQMTSALDWLEYFLNTIGMKHLRLDGTTKADDRQEMLEMFNAKNSDYFCFLLSTRAGGLGLNLQTADTVIIFDSDWNPMMDLQAQDRAHRIGQTKEVRVFRLICSGSVEVKILERATRKLQIESQVIQAGQFNNKSSDNDRHEMLKDLLRQQTDDDFARTDVTSLDEINHSLARGEHEIEVFEMVDEELKKECEGKRRLLESESELPQWILKPDEEQKDEAQVQAEYIHDHGRGRRKRKQIMYDDNLTEKEWTMAMEEEGDIEEAVKRKKRRMMMMNGDNENEGDENGDAKVRGVSNLNGKLANGSGNGEASVVEVDDADDADDDDDADDGDADIDINEVEEEERDVRGKKKKIGSGKRKAKNVQRFEDADGKATSRSKKKRGRPKKSSKHGRR